MNFAILGAGHIAEKMANTVAQMEGVKLYAVASRTFEKADAFAGKYGVAKAYGSYEEMLADEAVDLVYVATPHSHHYEHTKMCIQAGKASLVEKAFTVNANEAKELVELARERCVLLCEAMWVRFMPMSVTLKKLVDDGEIGDVVGLTANLGYSLLDKERLVKPELAGGALLDLGVYTMNFATWILGDEPEKIDVIMTPHITGVDKSEVINLTYKNGVIASLYSTMAAVTDRRGIIYGTKGRIEVENINNFEEIRVYDNKRELVKTIPAPTQISGYEYEVEACVKALKEGKIECPEMPLSHTLKIMEMLDEIRRKY